MTTRIPFWSPSREYKALRPEIDHAIKDVLERGDLILRKDVEEFEQKFAQYVGAKHVIGLNSGTDALYLSLIALGIGKGDEVITTSYTFRATVDAIMHAGATPVVADIGEDWTQYRTTRTKAIIPVHIAGEIHEWKPDPEGKILMIEDACQAIGAAPIQGTTACYSFYPAKILGCYGDGGAIATNDDELAGKLRNMRNHYKGFTGYPGYNSRLDNLQAAILNAKMPYLVWFVQRRKEIATLYDASLKEVVTTPKTRFVYQDYIIETKHAAALHDYLMQRSIQTMLNEYVFPRVCPKKPTCVEYEKNTLRLPCTPYHTDEEIKEIISAIHDFFLQVHYD